MILSHRHKFIFIKTRKSAGTSIEIALSKMLGPDDIVTPISKQDEAIRVERGWVPAQNFFKPFGRYRLSDWARMIESGKRLRDYWNHMPAAEIKELVGDEIWSSYYKFCVERNPWDKAVSAYYWQRAKHHKDFRTFIDKGGAYQRSDYDKYALGGRVAVDKVILFDQLTDGLEAVRARLDLPEAIDISGITAKTGVRDRKPMSELYDEYTRSAIETQFAREIKAFGFTFPG